jgi:TRAP-type C4-dicarboxylate transport system substrate-binding protein
MAISKTTFVVTVALVATCMLNACNQAKSPDQVARDTATAESKASDNTAKVEQSAGDKVNSAQTVVSDEKSAEAHTAAVEAEKVADTKAQGDYKVALAQCGSLGGDQQKACKAQADAALQLAQDQAKQARANSDPKP